MPCFLHKRYVCMSKCRKMARRLGVDLTAAVRDNVGKIYKHSIVDPNGGATYFITSVEMRQWLVDECCKRGLSYEV